MTILDDIYLETLSRCAPDRLVRQFIRDDFPRNVLAIGKCAGALFDGVSEALPIDDALVIVPRGYRLPQSTRAGHLEVLNGGHPDMTPESFVAGRRAIEFAQTHDAVVFLISGGGSACVESPLEPFTEEDLVTANTRLVASGIPIGEINTVRRHLSRLKGGRLGGMVRRAVTLIYSDVSPGALADVASGPTLADDTTNLDAANILERVGGCDRIVTRLRDASLPDTVEEIAGHDVLLVADNGTLTTAAAEVAREHGFVAIHCAEQIESDVDAAAEELVARSRELVSGQILVVGGEPTVVKRGNGRGGRCSELAVRFAMKAADAGLTGVRALFGSSDGADGNSGAAGVALDLIPHDLDRPRALDALAASDSFAIASRIGRPIMIPAAGNNLRDLYLLARG